MVFAQITSLALVDAINPCTLAVQTLLLSALVLAKGKRSAVLGGLLFTATIFGMYVLYGVGFLQAILALGIESQVRLVLKGLLVIMALVELNAYFAYRPGFLSMEMPTKLRPIAKKFIGGVENPVMAIPIAALASVLLLPCSSGPYVAALVILSSYEFIVRFPLILYYNLLFVLPMLALTGVVALGTNPKKLQEWRLNHIKELHLVAGLLLLAVLLMV